MTTKRTATTELNQDNWADEDEKEEFGTFKQASSETLASRQIKKARRRGVVESPAPNIFKGLSGFTGFGAASTASPPSFSFLDKNSKSDSAKKPTFEFSSSETAKKPSFDFLSKPDDSKPSDNEKVSKKVQSETVDSSKSNGINGVSPTPSTGSNKLFLASLKSLNTGVLQWVKQHVEENPIVNLTPVFDDYKKHFQELKKKYPNDSESEGENDVGKNDVGKVAEKDVVNEKENKPLVFGGSTTSLFGGMVSSSVPKDKSPEASKPAFSFGSTASAPSENSQESGKQPLFSFGASAAAGDKSPSKKMFSFGGSTEDKAPKLFSFGSSASVFDSSKTAGTGFSFAGATPSSTPAAADEKKNEDEPSDEPPKIEVKEVKEEDSLYDKKCKLYYFNDGSYVEKGVGTLFLKAAGDDGEKTQLLIRAFTNLGNILLNIILNKSVPAARAGKNGVIIICIPNPPLDGKTESKEPVKMLIKVKTGDDADELLKKIEELKK